MTYSITGTAPVVSAVAKTATTTVVADSETTRQQSSAKRVSQSSANGEETGRRCEWGTCTREFENAELLYTHVCDDHIGRKIKQNLNLNCGWPGCNVHAQKRDHITSHVRVHIPFKPYRCVRCSKTFKRPQDLRKHVKIHAEDPERTQGAVQADASPTASSHGAINGHSPTNDLQALAATAANYYVNPLPTAPAPQQAYVPSSSGAGFNGYGAYASNLLYSGGLGQGMPALSESRKRELDTMDDLFRAIKRREVNPASYPQVAEALAGLHGVDLSMPVTMAGPQSNAAAFQAGAQQPQQLAMPQMSLGLPPLANLKTKKDLINAENWLEQSHATAYEEALRASTQAASQQNLYSGHLSSPPEATSAHSPVPSLTSRASSYSTTHSTTPGTQPSVPVSLPSALSPGFVKLEPSNGLSPAPYSSPGSSYPRLPTASIAGDVSGGFAPVNSIKATAGLDAMFGGDLRRHHAGGMLQRAARPDPDAPSTKPAKGREPRGRADPQSEDSDSADAAEITRKKTVTLSVIDPRLHPSSEGESQTPSREQSAAPLSNKELFIIERLKELVLVKLQRKEYNDDVENDESDDETIDEDPERLTHEDEAPSTMNGSTDKAGGEAKGLATVTRRRSGESNDRVETGGGLSYPRIKSLNDDDDAH